MGFIYACGSNKYGQLGFKDENYYEIRKVNLNYKKSKTLGIKEIACGANHSIVLKKNGSIFVFGKNKYGQLGTKEHDEISEQLDPKKKIRIKISTPKKLISEIEVKTIKMIRCGRNHTLILCNNIIWGFGDNNFGQIGLGVEIKKTLEPKMLELKESDKILSISCGEKHSMILCDNHVTVLGSNINCQLDFQKEENRTFFYKNPTKKFFEKKVQKISCGSKHSLILTDKNELLVLGTHKSNKGLINNVEEIKTLSFKEIVGLIDSSTILNRKLRDASLLAINEEIEFLIRKGANNFSESLQIIEISRIKFKEFSGDYQIIEKMIKKYQKMDENTYSSICGVEQNVDKKYIIYPKDYSQIGIFKGKLKKEGMDKGILIKNGRQYFLDNENG